MIFRKQETFVRQGTHKTWVAIILCLVCIIGLAACTSVVIKPPPSSIAPTTPPQPIYLTAPTMDVLSLPGQRVERLVLDDDFLYWVGMPNERFIYRYPLHVQTGESVQPEIIAQSYYPQGVLLQLPLHRVGDWLLFFDSAVNVMSDRWALRRINLVTQEENTLVVSTGDTLLYGFTANEQYAAWSILDHDSQRVCQDEAVLIMADLATGRQTELDRACFQTEHSWSTLALSGDTLIASLLQNDVEDAPWSRVVHFDLAAGQPLTYTVISDLPNDRQTSLFSQVVGDWVLWQRGSEGFGESILFNLRTNHVEPFPIAAATTPCQYLQVTERWLTGRDCGDPSRLLLYDPAQRQVVVLQTAAVASGSVVAGTGNVIAVARAVEPETAKADSVIEWYEVDWSLSASTANGFSIQTPPADVVALHVRDELFGQLLTYWSYPEWVKPVSVTATVWPDSCLGAINFYAPCTPTITPGYRVIVSAGIITYTYHTDADGAVMRLVNAPEVFIGKPRIEWWQVGADCEDAKIGTDGMAFGECSGAMLTGRLLNEVNRPTQLDHFLAMYASFIATTPAGTLLFHGYGQQIATPAEQRMLAEWMRMVKAEAAMGRSGAGWGNVLTWRRTDNNTGKCDTVIVYVTGELYASPCTGDQATPVVHRRLNAAELSQLFAWIDRYGHFEVTEPATTGNTNGIQLYFRLGGVGTAMPTASEKQQLFDFAAQLFADRHPEQDNSISALPHSPVKDTPTAPACLAPPAISIVLDNYRTAVLPEIVQRLQDLAGSSRSLLDVQVIPVENSEAMGMPMGIGTWGESYVFPSGGFFVWQATPELWHLDSLGLTRPGTQRVPATSLSATGKDAGVPRALRKS